MPMKIKFLGPIQSPSEEVTARVEEEFPGGTMTELVAALGYPAEQVWFLSVSAGGERLAPGDTVAADADVTIMLLVGGG